jgi:hypothetical protein
MTPNQADREGAAFSLASQSLSEDRRPILE